MVYNDDVKKSSAKVESFGTTAKKANLFYLCTDHFQLCA